MPSLCQLPTKSSAPQRSCPSHSSASLPSRPAPEHFIGSRADFVPLEWCERLSELQDNVPPVPFKSIAKVLRKELGCKSWTEALVRTKEKSLASATTAQVHRCVTKSGRKVVLKVQYEDQEGLMKLDLRNLRKLAVFLQNNDMKLFDLVSIVSEFEAQIPQELNSEEEANIMREIGDNLRTAGILPRKVLIPELEDTLSTRRVLVMEYISGVRVDNLATLDRWGIDRQGMVHAVGEAFGQMILVDGLFHADPHLGNLLVERDGRVALIDFGQCKRIDQGLRHRLCVFYLALASEDPSAVATAFDQLGVVLDVE